MHLKWKYRPIPLITVTFTVTVVLLAISPLFAQHGTDTFLPLSFGEVNNNGEALSNSNENSTPNSAQGLRNSADIDEVQGDVTCDGTRNVIDALAIMQYEVEMRTAVNSCPIEPDGTTLNIDYGDTNGDGTVNVVDALFIMQCEVELENSLCPGPSNETPTPSPTLSPTVLPETNLAVNRAASQSSVLYGGVASRAVDGNTAGVWRDQNVTHSATESEPWWQVALADTGTGIESSELFNINRIVIHNRTDCCAERLADFHVFISESDMSQMTLAELLADNSIWESDIASLDGANIEIPAGATGRYVKIQLAGEARTLSLAEVQVFGYLDPTPVSTATATATPTPSPTPTETATPLPTLEPVPTATLSPTATPSPMPTLIPEINLAVDRNASQSSVVFGGDPSRAVDGDTNGVYVSGNSITHTDHETEPWWQVDLAGTDIEFAASEFLFINHIALYNRTDCCSDRLSDFYVFVSEQDMSTRSLSELLADNTVWRAEVGSVDVSTGIPVGTHGRYVKIQMIGSERVLSLAEVQVFGYAETSASTALNISRASAGEYAVESTGEQVVYLVSRYGVLDEASYPFQMFTAETSQATSQSDQAFATLGEFVLKDNNGDMLTDSLSFAAGQDTAMLIFEAIADEQIEIPEQVIVEFEEQPDLTIRYSSAIQATLSDMPFGIHDDSLLFVGTFGPEIGAETGAYGFITVRLSGDNSYGEVTVAFNGLTSEQTAAHIHIANPQTGPILYSLPMGQFAGERWDIRAAQHLSTSQLVLNALLDGRLYINVHSADYPAGEIWATLYRSEGSENTGELIFDYPAPAYEVLTGEALTQDIHRFLSQATFGATPDMVADMEARIAAAGGDRIAAYNGWIDEQMQMTAPSHLEYHKAARISFYEGVGQQDLYILRSLTGLITDGWYTASVYGKAQLRERIAFSLSQIMVAGIVDGGTVHSYKPMMVGYNQMLKENAFGPVDELLYDVSRHPAMGFWLSHFQNRKTTYDPDGNVLSSPDENYAREIMQLFSIGLLEQYPDGTLKLDSAGLPIETYTTDDIRELARVFTGWAMGVVPQNEFDYESGGTVNTNFTKNFNNTRFVLNTVDHWTPMINFSAFHDDDSKEILGYVFPANTDADLELRSVVDILASHPNSAPFLSRRMIERLTTSNPSAGYIYRTAAVYEESGGNMGEVVRAILLDPEMRNPSLATGVGYGRIKEPVTQVVSACRLMKCQLHADHASDFPLSDLTNHGLPASELDLYEADASRVPFSMYNYFQQVPLDPPSVFNWFDPFYSPPGSLGNAGIIAPELAYFSSPVTADYYNYMYDLIMNPDALSRTDFLEFLNFSTRIKIAHELPDVLLDAYMGVMDSDANGSITPDDASFNDESTIRGAIESMVDVADLYFCQGWLQGMDTQDDQIRETILTGLYDMYEEDDGTTDNNALNARDGRIKDTMLVLLNTPRCLVQK